MLPCARLKVDLRKEVKGYARRSMLRKSSQAFPQSSWDRSSFWNGQDIVSTNTGSNLSPPSKKKYSLKNAFWPKIGVRGGGGELFFPGTNCRERLRTVSLSACCPSTSCKLWKLGYSLIGFEDV